MKHDPYPLEDIEVYIDRERIFAEEALDEDLVDEHGDVGTG